MLGTGCLLTLASVARYHTVGAVWSTTEAETRVEVRENKLFFIFLKNMSTVGKCFHIGNAEVKRKCECVLEIS